MGSLRKRKLPGHEISVCGSLNEMFLPEDRNRPSVTVVAPSIESARIVTTQPAHLAGPAQSLAPQTSEADWKENRPTNKQRVTRKTKRPGTKARLKEDLGRRVWLMERRLMGIRDHADSAQGRSVVSVRKSQVLIVRAVVYDLWYTSLSSIWKPTTPHIPGVPKVLQLPYSLFISRLNVEQWNHSVLSLLLFPTLWHICFKCWIGQKHFLMSVYDIRGSTKMHYDQFVGSWHFMINQPVSGFRIL